MREVVDHLMVVELGLPVWLSTSDMPQTGGWTETISNAELAHIECIERIRRERLAAEAHTADRGEQGGLALGD